MPTNAIASTADRHDPGPSQGELRARDGTIASAWRNNLLGVMKNRAVIDSPLAVEHFTSAGIPNVERNYGGSAKKSANFVHRALAVVINKVASPHVAARRSPLAWSMLIQCDPFATEVSWQTLKALAEYKASANMIDIVAGRWRLAA